MLRPRRALSPSPGVLAAPLVFLVAGHGCGKKAPADAGPLPVAVGDQLVSFDALAPGAVSGYPSRTLKRLEVAKPAAHHAVVAMPAGLTLRVTWETRDDLFFARRYLTSWRVVVDGVSAATSCVVSKTEAAAPPGEQGTALSVTLSVDYVCTHGRNTSNVGNAAIGSLNEEGFTAIGMATGMLKPLPPEGDPVAVAAVHFTSKSSSLDVAATNVLDGFVKVMDADPMLSACVAFYGADKAIDALQTKRQDAVRKYLLEHGVARSRINESVSTAQVPPAAHDIELWPYDATCLQPTTKKRR